MQTRYQHVLTKEIYTLDEIIEEVTQSLWMAYGEAWHLPTADEIERHLWLRLKVMYRVVTRDEVDDWYEPSTLALG